MTYSARQRGYKASVAAAREDDKLYGTYSQKEEEWPLRNDISWQNGSSKQSEDDEISNMIDERINRGNRQ